MSNFYDMGTALIDVTSIAYIDTESKEVVLKSGFIFSAMHFTSLEVSQLHQIVMKSNTVYDTESILFLSQEKVQKKINDFMKFAEYDENFQVTFMRKNDSVYTLQRGNERYERVYHFNAHDSIRHVLQIVEALYEAFIGKDEVSEGGDEESHEGDDETYEQ